MSITAAITRAKTLPDSSDKSDFHDLVDTATIATTVSVNQADMANGYGTIYRGTSAPSDTDAIWVDTDNDYQVKVYNGSSWEIIPFSKKGSDIASASTIATPDEVGNLYDVTGTTDIDIITASDAGRMIVLQFDDALTVNDAENLKLNGNFTTATGSTLTLICDGTNWFEVTRSPFAINTAGMPVGTVLQFQRAQDQTARTLTHSGSAWAADNSKPQITEGAPYSQLSKAITASATTNVLLIEAEVQGPGSTGNGGNLQIALFKDSGADALCLSAQSHSDDSSASGYNHKATFRYSENPADTSEHTYSVRVQLGGTTGDPKVNQNSAGNNFGNTFISSLQITEFKAS